MVVVGNVVAAKVAQVFVKVDGDGEEFAGIFLISDEAAIHIGHEFFHDVFVVAAQVDPGLGVGSLELVEGSLDVAAIGFDRFGHFAGNIGMDWLEVCQDQQWQR